LFPDGTTWTFDGFLTDYSPKDPMLDKMTATATVKVTGDITINPAS
jgi:hypothetical protein